MVKNLPQVQETQETWVWSLGREDPLEREMATHSSTLAWKILGQMPSLELCNEVCLYSKNIQLWEGQQPAPGSNDQLPGELWTRLRQRKRGS